MIKNYTHIINSRSQKCILFISLIFVHLTGHLPGTLPHKLNQRSQSDSIYWCWFQPAAWTKISEYISNGPLVVSAHSWPTVLVSVECNKKQVAPSTIIFHYQRHAVQLDTTYYLFVEKKHHRHIPHKIKLEA